MRVTAAAALADTFGGRLSFDLPEEVALGFADEAVGGEFLVAMAFLRLPPTNTI